MKKVIILIFLLLLMNLTNDASTEIYSTNNGTIAFRSVANKELISDASNNLSGLLDANQRTFAFKIPSRSFNGLNNGLHYESKSIG